MTLPIDYTRQCPIKSKYIDSETAELGTWMVFGSRAPGLVDICDCQGRDLFINVPLRVANQMVDARNVWVNMLLLQLNFGSGI